MPTAIMPGSFDPPTRGHLNLIERAAECFEQLVVAVGSNVAKKPWFDADHRAELMEESVQSLVQRGVLRRGRVRVTTYSGLLVGCAQSVGATVVVKGIRDQADLSAELVQATHNRELGSLETLLLPADPRWLHVSSSAVKELVTFGVDPGPYVPEPVAAALRERLSHPTSL